MKVDLEFFSKFSLSNFQIFLNSLDLKKFAQPKSVTLRKNQVTGCRSVVTALAIYMIIMISIYYSITLI